MSVFWRQVIEETYSFQCHHLQMACILRKSVRALRVLRVGKNRPEMAIKKTILEKRSRKLEKNYQHCAGNSSKTDSPQCHHLQTPAS
jgi:hypothetical protein